MVKIRFEFRKAFNLLFSDGSIAGFCYLTKKNLNIYEKIFWLTVNFVMIAAMAIYVASLWQMNAENRTIVSLEAYDHPVSEVGFPGIAICNNNKIHVKMAEKLKDELIFYTEIHRKLNGFDPITDSEYNDILYEIAKMGSLYDFKYRPESGILGMGFQTALERVDRKQYSLDYENYDRDYDPSSLMQQLGTPCEELLQQCFWDGKERSCMEIFSSRSTFDGICCTFNYLRPITGMGRFNATDFKVHKEVKVRNSGHEYGLSVLINNDLDEEYMYSDLPTNGVMVMVFNHHAYPDEASGGLSRIIANIGLTTDIILRAEVIRATENLKNVAKNTRHCIVASEETTMFGEYQQSDCFLQCKVKSMLSLCNCLAFMIPREEDIGIRTCNLDDVPCLQRYKTKWMTHFPRGSAHVEELKVETHDSMYCEEGCLPNCDTTFFKASSSFAKMFGHRPVSNRSSNVKIYYGHNRARLYKQDVSQTWFELLSNMGGVFSLFLGFSILNVVEIAYYLIYKLVNIY